MSRLAFALLLATILLSMTRHIDRLGATKRSEMRS